jgi:membrane protein insertase Oxa1/YidC/SpoIIIJ|tara:strand:+ start:288 stop:524 length:237 start_codon:yes stop_codon:yes gene_type:complete
MQIDPMLMWNVIITVVLGPFAWAFSKMFAEIKRLQILLNRTREDYATKSELHNETKEIKELVIRIEQKLDRFIEKQNG